VTISRYELQSVVLLQSTIGGAEYHDSEACDKICQTGHLISMSRNLVKHKFHNKDSKMLLTYYALIGHLNTVNKTPMTVFCKLALFSATVVFGANFTERAPKCRCDDNQQNTS